jgi:alanine-synthesizing transaminase
MKGFSRRTGWDTAESAFAAAVREARSSGREIVDLTISNPTVCGFSYDDAAILAALADPEAMVYDADPMGMLSAREAVCGYYADHAARIDPRQVLLTTSTSEAYGYLFRVLCDAGDEVLVARPGYPLFDFLADVSDVTIKSYPLFWDFGWWIDFAELEQLIGPRTKAILVVNPANPTGHWTRQAERMRLQQLCAQHGLALIVDEVFLDYPVAGEAGESFARGEHNCLTFILSGLSKIAGLPQMKVGWCVTLGPGADEVLRRLEVVADTFLSMGAPAQKALPQWLRGRQGIQEQIRLRVRDNLGLVRSRHFPVESGWCVVLLLENGRTAEQVLTETGVVVHPGSFYGLAGPGRIVASLLGPVKEFQRGIELLG